MAEIERLSEGIGWIDLSFVKRDRTPRWAIEEGIRYILLICRLVRQINFLNNIGSNGVTALSITGFIKPIYSRTQPSPGVNYSRR